LGRKEEIFILLPKFHIMLKVHKRKFLTILSISVILFIGVAATTQEKKPKPNLKVLPKDIDHEELIKIMKGFNVSLGVKCNFCHAPSKTEQRKLDFASDEKETKLVARNMMKMTAKINKKYFNFNKGEEGVSLAVTCKTCHNGKEHPDSKIVLPVEE